MIFYKLIMFTTPLIQNNKEQLSPYTYEQMDHFSLTWRGHETEQNEFKLNNSATGGIGQVLPG